MPTPAPSTPTREPTATNTRVPTVTPRPLNTSTPTIVIIVPTVPIRPTATPTPTATSPPPPAPAPSPIVGPTATFIPRQYTIAFDAEDRVIDEGDCTELEWRVEGAIEVRLDGKRVSPTDSIEVCPERDTTYELSVRIPETSSFETREIEITVEENGNNNNNNNNNDDDDDDDDDDDGG